MSLDPYFTGTSKGAMYVRLSWCRGRFDLKNDGFAEKKRQQSNSKVALLFCLQVLCSLKGRNESGCD